MQEQSETGKGPACSSRVGMGHFQTKKSPDDLGHESWSLTPLPKVTPLPLRLPPPPVLGCCGLSTHILTVLAHYLPPRTRQGGVDPGLSGLGRPELGPGKGFEETENSTQSGWGRVRPVEGEGTTGVRWEFGERKDKRSQKNKDKERGTEKEMLIEQVEDRDREKRQSQRH